MNQKSGKALVVGAGISGIRAALDLAEYGYGVTLIDRSAHIGGLLCQLDHQFPNDGCGMCRMLPLIDRDAALQQCLRRGLSHENIQILPATELMSVTGEPGHFEVALSERPRWVDPGLCTGCGECTPVCPVEVPDEFNAGLGARKAIYLPVPHAATAPYAIDHTACSRCRECEKVCPTGAIRIPDKLRKDFRILVVDDELIVRDSISEWLEEEGFSVDTADSGPAALRRLGSEAYQLMLLDIKMPGMDGIDVLKEAIQISADLGVVLMTAYATVETAVEAMKMGALDYLVKPFDMDKLIPMVERLYEELAATRALHREVGAIVLSGGATFFDPASGKNTYGYGRSPAVVTHLEFERMLSGSGPFQGRVFRTPNGRPIRKIAWIQCAGSRDLSSGADFCSNICCMSAIKEAVLAKEAFGRQLETTIFYMDLRTFGKSYQRYRDRAETEYGVRFHRARVHTITANDKNGALVLRTADPDGHIRDENMDLAVLSVGQRPAGYLSELIEVLDLEANSWGFADSLPLSLTRTHREGVFLAGSAGGLKDIAESVIQASAAAAAASRVIHSSGGALALETPSVQSRTDFWREVPRILVIIWTGRGWRGGSPDAEALTAHLAQDPAVGAVEMVEGSRWEDVRQAIERHVQSHQPNRLLIGACRPGAYRNEFDALARRFDVPPAALATVDLSSPPKAAETDSPVFAGRLLRTLTSGIAGLRWADPEEAEGPPVNRRALVVGGGIAGMSAALAIADNGFKVHLVERSDRLGGNLTWISRTLEGHSVEALLEEKQQAVRKHPLVDVQLQTQVVSSSGDVGQFETIVEDADGKVQSLQHGTVILATGGNEAATDAYGHGNSTAVVTQKELACRLADGSIDPQGLASVVMIQCVGSREEPRNYCSRVCCATALKHALELRSANPALQIFILYRDVMSYGFLEAYYTRARQEGVLFIPYDIAEKPRVAVDGPRVTVDVREPLIDRPLQIEADLLVLATGVSPNLPPDLAHLFGAVVDPDGFFQQADAKWRPVDCLKEGVFACGLAHSPRNIPETIATAEAAAQQSLKILTRERLPVARVTARVRHAICSLCEQCIDLCPYGARSIDHERGRLAVNPAMCQGCGSCAAACPSGAAVLNAHLEQQMLEVIDVALG